MVSLSALVARAVAPLSSQYLSTSSFSPVLSSSSETDPLRIFARDAASNSSSTPSTLSMSEIKALEIVERTMSILSILGCVFILATFLYVSELKRRSFNRLLFLASWGNVLTNIATIIANSGPKAGDKHAVCQIQATLIQWFMPADTLWTFCMAVNVFLTFQTAKLKVNIKALEKWYFLFCYGLPAIPALTYLILDLGWNKDFYGNATLWCWISKSHNQLRIITFYGPVWIVIGITMALYAITGRAIHKGRVRNQKLRLAMSNDAGGKDNDEYTSASDINTVLSSELGFLTKCTEISQTSEPRKPDLDSPPPFPGCPAAFTSTSTLTLAGGSGACFPDSRSSSESSSVGAASTLPALSRPAPALSGSRSSTPSIVFRDSLCRDSLSRTSVSQYPSMSRKVSISRFARDRISQVTTTVTAAPLAGKKGKKGEGESGVGAVVSCGSQGSSLALGRLKRRRSKKPRSNTNKGAVTYATVAFLLYAVMLVVWVPSTINRIWGLAHRGAVNFPLNLAAALVLPLQGFFNSVIYAFTSRNELARIFKDWRDRRRRHRCPSSSHHRSSSGASLDEKSVASRPRTATAAADWQTHKGARFSMVRRTRGIEDDDDDDDVDDDVDVDLDEMDVETGRRSDAPRLSFPPHYSLRLEDIEEAAESLRGTDTPPTPEAGCFPSRG